MSYLEDEIATKEAIIKTLDSGSPRQNTRADMEAIENLRMANERLMQQMVELQKGLNHS